MSPRVDQSPFAATGRVIATEKVAGLVQFATAAQIAAGTRTDRVISPSSLAGRFSSPGPIGTTTPSTATFTKINGPAASNTTAAGSNAFGTVTLTAGTATVSTTAVTANSIILLTRQSVGSSTALGQLTIGTKTAGTSFVINAATQGTPGTPLSSDVSVVGWQIIN